MRGAERLLKAVAQGHCEVLRIDLVVNLPPKQEVILDAGCEFPQTASRFLPTFREAAKGGAVRVPQGDGRLAGKVGSQRSATSDWSAAAVHATPTMCRSG
jgi:hypothetical protein